MIMKTCIISLCLLVSATAVQANQEHQSASVTASASDVTRFSGKVLETMDAGGYTYIRVDAGTNKYWAAAPRLEVKVGDTVAVADAMAMPNHHSKTLNRDFDVVYFTGDVTVNGVRPKAEARPVELPKNHPQITGSAGPTKIDLSGIKKAKGGKSIEEIVSGKAKLNGHEVTVRGKVVKYNANILGKNWLHLRDGTGTGGANDLLVTSASKAKVGDTVVVTGVVALNKDFGSNYKYDVMLEDAKLIIE
jgi:hypothetical protein